MSVRVFSDTPSICLSFWPDAPFWCHPCGTHYNLKQDLICPGKSLESCASSAKAEVPWAMRKDLRFFFFLALFAREGLGVMEWSSLAGLAKPSLGTWETVYLLLQTRLLTAGGIHCAVLRQRAHFAMKEEAVCRFLGEHMQPAARAGAALGDKAAKPGWEQGWFSVPTPPMWGQSGRPGGLSVETKLRVVSFWQFAWTGELRLVFKNKSKKLGFQLLEKFSFLLKVYQMILQFSLPGRVNYVQGEEIQVTG